MSGIINITTNVPADTPYEPVNKNYLKPNGFRVVFGRLQNVEYFCQSINLPKMTLGAAMQPTPFVNIPHTGDKMEYDPFTIMFKVDEDMANYLEIYNWMVGLGFPKSHDQYAQLLKDPASRFSQSEKMLETNLYSDCSLFILNNNNEPFIEVRFYDAFPVSMEGLDFDLRVPTIDYFTGIATFNYKFYEIKPLNSSYDSWK